VAARSDGARQWATVLSELAGVPVALQWERPAWRVRWVDGPTRTALVDRATALGRYRVGAPLPAEELHFSRSSSAMALALAWLAVTDQAGRPDAVGLVEQFAEDTGYPQHRADPAALTAADLLSRLAGGQSPVMGRLLAQADPAVPPHPQTRAVPDLAGRVASVRWPTGGPPNHLLGPTEPDQDVHSDAGERTCAYCGTVLPPRHGRGPAARYCSGAHRLAAHRDRRRGGDQSETSSTP
jgi:hypothetical protein